MVPSVPSPSLEPQYGQGISPHRPKNFSKNSGTKHSLIWDPKVANGGGVGSGGGGVFSRLLA